MNNHNSRYDAKMHCNQVASDLRHQMGRQAEVDRLTLGALAALLDAQVRIIQLMEEAAEARRINGS